MPTFEYQHRVRFRECDPMGVVYHAHCIDWFEEARTEALRALGVSYAEIQDSGIDMPVIDLAVTYRRPVLYDDIITIVTRLPETLPTTRIRFAYEVYRETGDRPAIEASVTLCFMDRARARPVSAPAQVLAALRHTVRPETNPGELE